MARRGLRLSVWSPALALIGYVGTTTAQVDTIRNFRTTIEAGQLQFKDGNQKDASLPVSFKRFGTAFDALQKE